MTLRLVINRILSVFMNFRIVWADTSQQKPLVGSQR